MAATAESIARELNEANLTGITSCEAWSDLVQNYFATQNESDSDEDSSESGGDSDSPRDSASVTCSDSNSTVSLDLEESEIEAPFVVIDETPAIIQNGDLNLVSEDDTTEENIIRNFRCKCKHNNGLPCHSLFMWESVREYRLQIHDLERHEKDLVILAQIAAHIQRSDETLSVKKGTKGPRKLSRVLYFHEGSEICRDMFKFLHSVSQDKLTGLIKRYKENGLAPRKCRSGGRINKKALSFEDVTNVVHYYITNYAEANALVLPGRVPGFKRDDIKLLPSSDTKASIWRTYRSIMKSECNRAVKLSSFRSLWRQLMPFIVMCKPMTDLCWKCQDNNTKIFRSANLTEEEKSDTLREQEEHLRVVKLERSFLNSMVADLKDVVTANNLDLGETVENSRDITSHYSFDFAQQVFYPNDPLQPGPIYFLVPRKCAIFGVCCEGIPKQVNFLIDEGSSVSKGSNSVISYLDYFFAKYGLCEKHVNLHADNCSGQNKNKFMLWYLCWRTLHSKHSSIAIHFLITGHTKFAPDWCFGLLKQKYRRTPVSCLADMEDVVRNSTVTGANVPQLVGTEGGQQIVPTRDWHIFLDPYFRPMPGVKSFQHFRFESQSPGVVFYKQYSDSPESSFQLLKHADRLPPVGKPTAIRMPPLDHARASYLFSKIRPFVREDVRDVVCPVPQASVNRQAGRKRTREDGE